MKFNGWGCTSHPHLSPNVVAMLSVIPSTWQVEQEDLSLRPSWGYRERERACLYKQNNKNIRSAEIQESGRGDSLTLLL